MRPTQWALSREPRVLRGYVAVVDAVAVGALVMLLTRTEFRVGEIGLAALLFAGAVVNVEALRRIGEPAGVFSDLQAVWTLPMALLLPPVFGVVAPGLLNSIQQIRVNRAVPYRRIFSSAAIGLCNLSAALILRALINAPIMTGAVAVSRVLDDPVRYMGAALVASIAASLLNLTIILVAVKISAPETVLRDVLFDSERLILLFVELCAGLIVTVIAAVDSLFVIVAVPPMLLLQRSVLHGQLTTAARLDGKTGLLNAVTWNREAEQAVVAGHGRRNPVSVLLIDLDHFKQVNDRHGHLVGDQVLKLVADALASQVRKADLAGRFGGEEFVLLLADTPQAEAGRIAERLRTRIAATSVEGTDGDPVGTTVSIGIASQGPDGSDLMELLAAADTALYRAKSAGRNRTCLASEVS